MATRLTVRALSCDAKIIGSLVGGCRVRVMYRDSGEVLAEGLHVGGSGNTESIMAEATVRGSSLYSSPGTAAFETELFLDEPIPVEISVEGPLAFPHAAQRASVTTTLIPGQHIEGDGIVVKLFGFIVDILKPGGVDEFRSGDEVELEAGVRLL